MNKLFKKVITMLLAVLLIVTSTSLMFGCGDDDEGNADGSGANNGTNQGGGEDDFDFESIVSIDEIQAKYDASLYKDVAKPVEIKMAHHDNEGVTKETAVLQILLKAFNKRYPNISVKLDVISEYEDTYRTDLQSGEHDVFAVPDGQFKSWLGTNQFVNLTGSIANSSLIKTSDMYSSANDRFKDGNQQYVVPRDISSHVMYYNKDMLTQYGIALPPSDRIMTMDEAVTMWKEIRTKSNGTVYGNTGLGVEGLVWSAGGDFLNDARDAFPTDSVDTNAIRKAYQFIQDAYYTHDVLIPKDQTGSLSAANLFMQKRVATLIDGSWNMASFRGLDFDWDIAYVPAFETEPTKNGWSGSVGYAISKSSSNKAAAWKLVEYIGSKEGQEILSATGFQFPLYKSLGLDEGYIATQSALKPSNYKIYIDSAMKQPAGLWTYKPSTKWKESGYDACSENLLHSNAGSRDSIDTFMSNVQAKVNENINR